MTALSVIAEIVAWLALYAALMAIACKFLSMSDTPEDQ